MMFLLRWNTDRVQIFFIEIKALGTDDVDTGVEAEFILTVTPGLKELKGLFNAQNGSCVHDVAAQITIVENALSDHGLDNTFLHQALGFRLGVERYDFPACLTA